MHEHVSVATDVLDVPQAELHSGLVGAVHYRIEQQLVLDYSEYAVHDSLASHSFALVHVLQLVVLMQLLEFAESLAECSVYQCSDEFLSSTHRYCFVIDLQQPIVDLQKAENLLFEVALGQHEHEIVIGLCCLRRVPSR